MGQVTKMTNKVKRMGFRQKKLTFCWFGRERERGGEKKRRREIQASLFDPRSSVGRNSSSQE